MGEQAFEPWDVSLPIKGEYVQSRRLRKPMLFEMAARSPFTIERPADSATKRRRRNFGLLYSARTNL